MNASTFDRRTALGFVAVTLIWGSTWLVIKGQLGTVPPAWSVAYRFIIASVTLGTGTVASRQWHWPTRRAHAFAAVIGLAQFMVNFNLVYVAEQRLPSGLVALVFALLVVPNTLFAAMFLKTPLNTRFFAGAAIAIAGLVLLFAHDLSAPGSHRAVAVGLACVGTAVLSASVANVMQAGQFARSLPPLPTLTLAMAYGALFDATFALITSGAPVFDGRAEYWCGVAYLSLMASVLAFSIYYHLIRRIGPGPAAYTSVLVPVVALLLSTLFEGYRWTPLAAAGAALALCGVAIALGRGVPRLRRRRAGLRGTSQSAA